MPGEVPQSFHTFLQRKASAAAGAKGTGAPRGNYNKSKGTSDTRAAPAPAAAPAESLGSSSSFAPGGGSSRGCESLPSPPSHVDVLGVAKRLVDALVIDDVIEADTGRELMAKIKTALPASVDSRTAESLVQLLEKCLVPAEQPMDFDKFETKVKFICN